VSEAGREPPRDAVRAYKDVIGELTGATAALRERDRRRAEALKGRLAELAKVTADAEERAAVARFVAQLHWETVLDALWQESWMTLRRRPGPDPDADPADLDVLNNALVRAAEDVLEAVRRRTFGLGR
jgi:hypothetical protein